MIKMTTNVFPVEGCFKLVNLEEENKMKKFVLITFVIFITVVTLSGNTLADEVKAHKTLKYDDSYENCKTTGDYKLIKENTPQGIDYKWVPIISDELSNDKPYDTSLNTPDVKSNDICRSLKSDPVKEKNFSEFSNDSLNRSEYKIGDQITLKFAKPAGPAINPLSTDNIYSQNFNTVPPGGWATYSAGPDSWEWREEGTNNLAWCNSDLAGPGTDITEWLYMTSGVDCSYYENLVVRFESLYDYYNGDEYCQLLYATDETYPTFTIRAIWDSEEDEHPWTPMNVPLHDSLDNCSELHIAFRYHGTYDWHWKVDNLVIIGDDGGAPEEFWARVWVDGSNGSVNFEGDNPGGNGSVNYQHAYVQYSSWPGFYHWRIGNAYNEPGWVDYVVNCLGVPDSVKLSWHGHATTSGGQNYTYLYLDVNDNILIDGQDFQPNNSWTTYYTILGPSYLNNGHNHFRVGCSESSSTYYAVRWIKVELFYSTSIVDHDIQVPKDFILLQNYPNPFNAQTTISYELVTPAYITLQVYDILGREVETLVSEQKQAGCYSITWNASDQTSGMYFYKIQAGDYAETKKMVLLK